METFRTSSTGANCKRRRQIKWRWTLEEDYLLMKLVKRHGPGNWDHIAYHMQGRSGKSCRLRWINQLNPKVDRTPFSEEERQRLLKLHEKYGNRWSIIVSHFPGRTDNQVKNQYHLLVGTKYMKASGASCSPDLKRGSIGFPLYGSMSTVSVGSKFSDGSCQGNNYCGFGPCYNAMSGWIALMPVFGDGSSSVYSKGEPWLGVNLANIYPHQGISHGDSSMMSDANSAAFSEFRPVPQVQQGVGTKGYQFIDFMGVGSSE